MSSLFSGDFAKKFFIWYLLLAIVFAAAWILDFVHIRPVVILAAWFLIYVVGVEIGYHRLFTHRSFQTSRAAERMIALFALFAGQGSAIFWVATHRVHHRFSDTPKDPHTPTRGWMLAAFFWQFDELPEGRLLYAKELMADPYYRFLHLHHYKIFWSLSAATMLISPTWYLNLILMPLFISRLCSAAINTLGHSSGLGYQSYATQDRSKNSVPMGLGLFGLGWHNFHHAHPQEPYLSRKWRRRFYEFDLSAPVIHGLQYLAPRK